MTNQKDVLSVEQLLALNEQMVGRGVPNREDGVGYNKADYSACANYFNGLSDAQIADLAKRLVKYSETQLHLDKEMMKETAKYYAEIAGEFSDRTQGVSLNITENGTLISFRYNEEFIEIIKKQPKRRYDAENKQWIVPNERVIPTLNELAVAGADVDNALVYATNHPLLKNIAIVKEEILVKDEGDWTLLKFKYNEEFVKKVKEIPSKYRQWNPQFKFWAIKTSYLEGLKNSLEEVATFKEI